MTRPTTPAQFAAWERVWRKLLAPPPDESEAHPQRDVQAERGGEDANHPRRALGPGDARDQQQCTEQTAAAHHSAPGCVAT
jgi:hypothetical protein